MGHGVWMEWNSVLIGVIGQIRTRAVQLSSELHRVIDSETLSPSALLTNGTLMGYGQVLADASVQQLKVKRRLGLAESGTSVLHLVFVIIM